MSSLQNASPELHKALVHWRLYGQRGKTPNHRVCPWEWDATPFKVPASTPWKVTVEPDQLLILLLGFLPVPVEGQSCYLPLFLLGEPMLSHRFMSTSTRPDMKASEDKWFVYADGPDHNGEVRLHMHRSWTGLKQIELVIDAGFEGFGSAGDGASITSIIWESSLGDGKTDVDAEAQKEKAKEVCAWVLNVRLGPRSSWLDQDDRHAMIDPDDFLSVTKVINNTTLFRRN